MKPERIGLTWAVCYDTLSVVTPGYTLTKKSMSRTVPVEVRSGQRGQQLPRLDLDAADDFHRGFFSEPSRHSRFSADEGMCLWNLQPKLLLKDFMTWKSSLDNGGKWFSLISWFSQDILDGFPKVGRSQNPPFV